MEKTYMEYKIEITPLKDSGKWTARVDFSPTLPGGNRGGLITNAAKGGYNTQEEAEVAALAWAKALIDRKSSPS